MSLNGKVAVIAGATGGLGQVVTKRLAEEGLYLVLLGREKKRLNDLLTNLDLDLAEHFTHAVDLTSPDNLERIAAEIQAKFGRIDLLINLVGGWAGGETLVEVQPETLDSMLNQHLWSSFYLTQTFIPILKENKSGRVITISSPMASNPAAKSGAYVISKAAQDALMLTLSEEMKGSGVTANIIQVRAIDVKHRRQNDPTGKFAGRTTSEEIASAIVYLSSDDAQQLNGIHLPLFQ